MTADQERTETAQDLVCAVWHAPIQLGQDRVTVQEQHYHARCYERQNADRPPVPVRQR
jgi:hypothetical protein